MENEDFLGEKIGIFWALKVVIFREKNEDFVGGKIRIFGF